MKKEGKNVFKKIDFLILFTILLVALLFRWYKIDTPLADLHSWRQADTAAVSRNFVRESFNLLIPKYDDLSNIQSGRENPQGYRMVEFPLYNAVFAALYKYLPLTSLEKYGRLTTMGFSLILIGVLYYLLIRETNRFSAIIGSLIYATFPFFVFFSRVVLPETFALSTTFLSLLSLYFFVYTKNKGWGAFVYVLSLLFFAIGVLAKPTVIFFALAHFALFARKYRLNVFAKFHVYFFFLLALLPFFFWRYYILGYPEGIPSSEWLITHVNTSEGLKNIYFRPAFFRWIFYERINNLILGGFLSAFLILGVLAKPRKYFFHSVLFASMIYLFVFQGGNVQHEYYQTLILPALSIFVALGVNVMYQHNKLFVPPVVSILAVCAVFLFSFFISFNTVKNFYNYPSDLVSIAKIINDLTEENDKLVTDTIGDTTLLYLSERRGAPAPYKDLKELKKDNYKYFITLNRGVISDLKTRGEFQVLFENDKFAIFSL